MSPNSRNLLLCFDLLLMHFCLRIKIYFKNEIITVIFIKKANLFYKKQFFNIP